VAIKIEKGRFLDVEEPSFDPERRADRDIRAHDEDSAIPGSSCAYLLKSSSPSSGVTVSLAANQGSILLQYHGSQKRPSGSFSGKS